MPSGLVLITLFLFQVTEADDEDYDSVDSSEASDQAKVPLEAVRGHMTDDSGIDSITVSPTREAGGMMETLLTMAMAGKKHYICMLFRLSTFHYKMG